MKKALLALGISVAILSGCTSTEVDLTKTDIPGQCKQEREKRTLFVFSKKTEYIVNC